MLPDNQRNVDHINGSNETDSSFTGPYRHAGYKRALSSLREALNFENAVILKGVEGTGKSTLINEFISEYHHKGVPVAIFNEPLTKTSQLYSKLADTLEVPKQKKELIRALRNTKDAGQFCLVIIDQQAINSDDSIVNALQQLCKTSETTAGAIKLVVIRQDYMVLHPEAESFQQADFSNWINIEVTLDPLHIDDIEGYIYYLSAIKGLPPTPYEIGTDFMMIDQTEGRIGRLKALLLPLIHKDVITRKDFQSSEGHNQPLTSANSGVFALGLAIILAIGIGINQFFLSDESDETAEVVENSPPIFAEPKTKASTEKTENVAPPSITTEETVQTPESSSDNSPELANTLPTLSPELENDSPKSAPPQQIKATTLDISEVKPPVSNKKDSRPVEDLASLPPAEFQAEVNSKLTLLEEQLSAAIEENNRLKQALENAEQKQSETVELAVAIEAPQTPDVEDTNSIEIAASHTSETTDAVTNQSSETPDVTTISPEVNIEETQTVEELTKTEEIVVTALATDSEISSEIAPALVETALTTEKAASPQDLTTTLIDRWTNAWQAQDHETYTASYISEFNGAYKTHQHWLKKRYDALNRPEWIKLTREELRNIKQHENEIRVDFWLKYEAANGYKDRTFKRLTLVFKGDEWLIAKEQNIKVEPYF
ncbi:AAA family ATPase [Neptuniibacter sp. QD34_54]|uniref:AAA family ATPase n=1 Tax=Neptuniibacter sp. QD34_54 TaxID=3398208 RepID=UPI0039F555E1